MRGALQGVAVAALPGGGNRGGFLSALFGGGRSAPAPAASTVGAAPVPPADIGARSAPAGESAGLDGWLLNNFFGRR